MRHSILKNEHVSGNNFLLSHVSLQFPNNQSRGMPQRINSGSVYFNKDFGNYKFYGVLIKWSLSFGYLLFLSSSRHICFQSIFSQESYYEFSLVPYPQAITPVLTFYWWITSTFHKEVLKDDDSNNLLKCHQLNQWESHRAEASPSLHSDSAITVTKNNRNSGINLLLNFNL